MKSIKSRLAAMYFLEFAVWGAYLTSLGAYLSKVGLSGQIGWFYAIQGIVSLFMPALIGILADRWIPAQKMLSLCQIISGCFMGAAGVYGLTHAEPDFAALFSLYSISVAFYMPTIGLSNSVGYTALRKAGLDTVRNFPPIRIWGTIGFIIAMLFVNFTGYQNTSMQMVVSAVLGMVLTFYALTMPDCPVNRDSAPKSIVDALGLRAFRLFRDRQMATFFIFSMLLGVALQITNGFANPFIQAFGSVDIYKGAWGVDNANALISISQISETFCILLIPVFMKRFGIKVVMLMAMFAWVLRFGLFGLGNPNMPGVLLFILSMIVYGIAFDFFNVSGSLFVDSKTDKGIRSSAQGLFMMMTNGIGATIGTLVAQAIIDHNVFSRPEGIDQIHGWQTSWFIFAGYALVVGVLFMLLFHETKPAAGVADAKAQGDPEGLVDL